MGFRACDYMDSALWYASIPGAIIAECACEIPGATLLGRTVAAPSVTLAGEPPFDELLYLSEQALRRVYPTRAGGSAAVESVSWEGRSRRCAKPRLRGPRRSSPYSRHKLRV